MKCKEPDQQLKAPSKSRLKFAMSYSCGKDSTLALHKMLEKGHKPVCLVIMVNEAAGRSYFHGADNAMLQRYAQALKLPLITCPSNGADYQESLETGLMKAKIMGANAACFGDIDLAQNRQWEEARCKAVGLLPCFPLWQRKREDIVYESIRLGYKCIVKSIHQARLPLRLLGTPIDETALAAMRAAGIDICGENGEYHTLAVDGPVFHHPLPYQIGGTSSSGDYAFIEIY